MRRLGRRMLNALAVLPLLLLVAVTLLLRLNNGPTEMTSVLIVAFFVVGFVDAFLFRRQLGASLLEFLNKLRGNDDDRWRR
jgi:hypothetical protein